MAAKQTKKKKNRISKHVLQAKEKQNEASSSTGADPSSAGIGAQQPQKQGPTVMKKAKKNKHHVKNPNEAIAYLSAWKQRDHGPWKFNKNTQSWIIRHMYDSKKVSKTTFTIMLDYLNGMPEGPGRTRVMDDARGRAMRYKEYEGTRSSQDSPDQDDGKETNDDKETQSRNANGMPDGGEDDATRWKKLSDHDKRKEYKRARKVLEILQGAASSSTV